MYQFNKYHGIVLLWLAVLMAYSCKKDAGANYDRKPLPGTWEYIQKEPRFSLLTKALVRCGLDKAVMEGNITVFAPTDSAFVQAGWNAATISSLTPDSIRFVLSYHIAPGIVGGENIIGFYKTFPLTLNKDYKPYITKNYYGLFLNGNHIDRANLKMGDGLIHEIGALSFPPVDSLLPTLYKQPDLTIFSVIVKKCKNLENYLKKETITLIVPTDKAFIDSGYTLSSIADRDTLRLEALCWAYIGSYYRGRLYSSDFIGGYRVVIALSLPDLGYKVYQYSISPDGTQIEPFVDELISGNTGIKIPPKFLPRKNILSKGGIIHTVDQMFRPSKLIY